MEEAELKVGQTWLFKTKVFNGGDGMLFTLIEHVGQSNTGHKNGFFILILAGGVSGLIPDGCRWFMPSGMIRDRCELVAS